LASIKRLRDLMPKEERSLFDPKSFLAKVGEGSQAAALGFTGQLRSAKSGNA
jgi:hypothetical protein